VGEGIKKISDCIKDFEIGFYAKKAICRKAVVCSVEITTHFQTCFAEENIQ